MKAELVARVVLTVAALAWTMSRAAADEAGTPGVLQGRVLDEAGQGIAGARVTATGLQAGQDYATSSTADGAYRVTGMSPGLYVVAAESSGFAAEIVSAVSVAAGAPTDLDLRLHVLTIEDLMRIRIISAAKIEQRANEAPSVVSVVPREQIDLYGWGSLNEILYRQPGFGPAQDYDRRTVASRGLFEGWNNNHILHLVDGIPFNDNLYGTAYTWEVTPLFMARTVEVLRGPGSALYGSNAANGVVQVNTVRAEDLDGRGEARVRVGNADTRVYDFVGGTGLGNLASGVIGYNAYETDGHEYESFDGSGRVDGAGHLATFHTNDRRESRYFWAKLDGRRALEGLSLQYHEQYWSFQTGHGWLWFIPDFREAMDETRRILSLSWRPKANGRLGREVLVRFQRHAIDWRTRYYPNDAFESFYPAGMWESLDTGASDVFARVQGSLKLDEASSLLFGIEGDRFGYGGDDEHDSNIDVDDAANFFPPFAGDRTQRLGPWLDYIRDQPILNVGLYAQYARQGLLGGKMNLTAGGRFDRTAFDFRDIRVAPPAAGHRVFSRFSPRLAVVLVPSPGVSLKLLGGRAFRAPSPTELAGAHTFSLASNIDELQPEVITTGELALDWKAGRFVNVRASAFLTEFENQIAYSAGNFNLSTNIYTLKTAGLEAEVLVSRGSLSGFLNYAWARRLDEEIIDTTVALSTDELTWEPAHKVNAGLAVDRRRFTAALHGHWQGSVGRRESDVGRQTLPYNVIALDMDATRPRRLESWVTVDGRVSWKLPKRVVLGVTGTNLFDADLRLVKVLPFPFDYRQEGRRVQVTAGVSF